MPEVNKELPQKVVIVTGFSPVTPTQMAQMGMAFESFPKLLSMLGKDLFRFSIPSIGPAVLAAYLIKHDIDVDVKDFFYDKFDFNDYDLIGVSSTFLSDGDVADIVNTARRQNPSAYIVLGGPISWSVPPKQLMLQLPSVDYMIVKSGEQSLVDLIAAIRNNEDLGSVESLIYRGPDGDILENPVRPPTDLGEFTSPAWKLMSIPSPKRIPVLPVETSRGCPNNCAYCSEVTYWGKPVRYRTIESVVNELKSNVSIYGISTFRFTDSCFSAPPERSGALCDAIFQNCIKEGISIKWSAYSRVDNLSYDLLSKMKRSGCIALDLGLESGSLDVLRKMGRGYTPDEAIEITKVARDLGIFINFNVIIGFPGETRETVKATTETINKASPDTFSCFLFHLPPNTKVFSSLDYYRIKGKGHDWVHDTMSSQEANEAMMGLIQQATNSTHFPGGEYFACFLASLGYSISEIRFFFKSADKITDTINDQHSAALFKEMVSRLSNYV